MLTRRRLLASLPAAACAHFAPAQFLRHKPLPRAFDPAWVYIGTDTAKSGAKGIYRARFDPNKGTLTQPELAISTPRGTWLAVNEIARAQPPSRRLLPVPPIHVLYCCNEGADEQSSFISTFSLNLATGALTLLGQVSAGGAGPCFLSVDASGRSAFVANYAGGSVASYSVHDDGTLSDPVQRIDFHTSLFGQHGPNKARQDGPHPHSATLSPDGRFVLVNDLGNDQIVLLPRRVGPGALGSPQFFRSIAPGAGPRHIAFHPNGRWVYGIDELANRVDQYLFTSTHAQGSPVDAQAALTATGRSVSTLDAVFHGTNTAAEVAISPLGDFLYASNRGEDSLVVFKVSETDGSLTFIQRIACGGRTPRHFTLDRSGDWIFCGNQDSASVTLFARNPGTGRLTGPTQSIAVESPMYTLLVETSSK